MTPILIVALALLAQGEPPAGPFTTLHAASAQPDQPVTNDQPPPGGSLFPPQVGTRQLEGAGGVEAPTREAGPDLVVEALDTPDFADPGDAFSVEVTLRNNGAAPVEGGTQSAPSYELRLAVSADPRIDMRSLSLDVGQDVALPGGSTLETPALAAGGAPSVRAGTLDASRTVRFDALVIPQGSPPGLYFLCAVVDASNAVVEQDEDNNVNCNPFFIRPENVGL